MTSLTRSWRWVEWEAIGYRRVWRGTVISSFVNPVLFLSAMGLGLGTLVDSSTDDLGVPYLTFVATGLMAATAMQTSAGEGAFPVMAGIKWRKEFHGAITTPLSPTDIVRGKMIWGSIRLTFVLTVFALISVAFGALDLGPALLAVPPAVLTGLAFQATVTAFTVTRENEVSLSTLFRFGIIPLFLFSGTFFPISQLPDPAAGGRLFHAPVPWCRAGAQGRPPRGRCLDRHPAADLGQCRLSGGDGRRRHRPRLALAGPEAQAVSVSAPSRLTPPGRMTPFRAQRIWERNYLVYRRVWKVVITGFFEPVFYLFSIGIGIGSLVGRGDPARWRHGRLHGIRCPGLDGSVGDERDGARDHVQHLFPAQVRQGLRRDPHDPDGTRDIAIGEIGWALLRGALYAVAFLVVMVIMGLTTNWWAILTIPGAVLIGFAFGSVGLAATTYMRSWQDFDLVSLVTMPLFLFSATFYPLDTYPPALQQLVRLSPLYQGNELLRAFSLGIVDWSVAGHIAYLLVMGLIGARIASRRLDGLLRK